MRGSPTRRDVLRSLVAIIGALIAPRIGKAQRAQPSLHVSVHRPGGEHLECAANVVVQSARGGSQHLERRQRELVYSGDVGKGRYRLRVQADGFAPVDLPLDVTGDGAAIAVYLGQPQWPAFRMARSIVPFEPRDDLVAVAFVSTPPSREAWEPLLREAEQLGLLPYPDPGSYLAAHRTIAFFQTIGPRLFATPGDLRAPEIVQRLHDVVFRDSDVRVGVPIDTRPGRIKILDNQYVVRFASARSIEFVQATAKERGAIARQVEGFDNTWLFEFRERNNYRAHLAAAEALLASEGGAAVVYAEPNLVFQLRAHGCTGTPSASCTPAHAAPATSDPWSTCQQNLVLQGVPEAWCFLDQKLGAEFRYGCPDVCIATVDAAGFSQAHPDIDGARVEYVNLCTDCGAVEDPHGTAVLGIVAATPGNSSGIAGIASGVSHLAVQLKREWDSPDSYAQMLLWLSGVGAPGFPAKALGRPADIIVCSHSIENVPPPSLIADALVRLTTKGRLDAAGVAALGTILVYSSGNAGTDLSGTQALAAHPAVIAVGNTLAPVDGIEVRETSSNFGHPLSLCAQGERAPSLLFDLSVTPPTSCTPPVNAQGVYEFSGTSAACPMVGAAAALMLSLNQGLTWLEVRDLLRQTAQVVDVANGQWSNHRSYWYGSGRLDVNAAVRAAWDARATSAQDAGG